jgi:hypothetical protein
MDGRLLSEIQHFVPSSVWYRSIPSREPRLLQAVADDRYFKARILEAIHVVKLELGILHVKVVVPSGNHCRNR